MRIPLKRGFYDAERGIASIDGEEVRLRGTERRLLDALVAKAGEVVGYEALLVDVWDAHPHGSLRPIESTLARLRKRLGESGRSPVHLHTEYGEGLRFVPAQPPPVRPTPPAAPVPMAAAEGEDEAPLPPAEAVDWLREHGGVQLPLQAVVAHVGGHPEVLRRVAELGPVLTRETLERLEPLDLAWDGRTLRQRRVEAYDRLSAEQRRCVHAIAAFEPPVDPSSLAEALGRPLFDVLADVARCRQNGWLYSGDDGVGVDVAVVRWLEQLPGHADALAVHRAFLDGQRRLAQPWRWYRDVQRARRRSPQWRPQVTLPGEVWITKVLGGDPTHPVDQALVRATSLQLTQRLTEAVAVFEGLTLPEEPAVRVRWAIVGTELAAHVGDLTWHREVHALARDDVPAAAAPLRFQFYCNELELRHLEHGELEEAKERAMRAALDQQAPARARFVESLYLHYRFQRHPSAAILERQLALVAQGADSGDHMLIHAAAAERELSSTPTIDVDAAVRAVGGGGRVEAETLLLLQLALASLPDQGEAERLLTRSAVGQHASNRLRRALLERILHGRDDGLVEHGGQALVQRVDRLLAGDAEALAGEGWFVLRHALRLGSPSSVS